MNSTPRLGVKIASNVPLTDDFARACLASAAACTHAVDEVVPMSSVNQ